MISANWQKGSPFLLTPGWGRRIAVGLGRAHSGEMERVDRLSSYSLGYCVVFRQNEGENMWQEGKGGLVTMKWLTNPSSHGTKYTHVGSVLSELTFQS